MRSAFCDEGSKCSLEIRCFCTIPEAFDLLNTSSSELSMSEKTLLTHKFDEPTRLWLELAANTPSFDPRIARAKLHEQIPRDFDPFRIDSRFYKDDQATILALRIFNPNTPVLANAERVAIAVRDEILRNPGINDITLEKIAQITGLSGYDTHFAIVALENIVPFFSGKSHDQGSASPTRYSLAGPRGYDAPLSFTSIDEAMETSYKLQSFFPNQTLDHTPFPLTSRKGSSVHSESKKDERATMKKDSAFVIMAMDPDRPELTDVLDAIKSVCASFGIKAQRADDIQHQDRITNIVLNEIRNCEYLIADLTYERPNVYYEVGFAHAIEKKPILYRRAGTPLHFDLSVHNVPEYKNIKELRELLQRRFEAILGRNAT